VFLILVEYQRTNSRKLGIASVAKASDLSKI